MAPRLASALDAAVVFVLGGSASADVSASAASSEGRGTETIEIANLPRTGRPTYQSLATNDARVAHGKCQELWACVKEGWMHDLLDLETGAASHQLFKGPCYLSLSRSCSPAARTTAAAVKPHPAMHNYVPEAK
ncbi:hypothetical protein ColTof4_08777 [Colletotrichum tofieldiae]|nr:hypothetical protein ColTof3_04017 [Colletotrichum tofieldiae]GKT76354.1 hypothetical protein ColTof4_08777 [Colletotrichum tofieldiae]